MTTVATTAAALPTFDNAQAWYDASSSGSGDLLNQAGSKIESLTVRVLWYRYSAANVALPSTTHFGRFSHDDGLIVAWMQ